ncbi:ESS family glutamate:Na+ symporter [Herbaspirillum sp. Sphag1AN]|uniref:sodium/glutamate symporter n=1 Tax=unclassified Herbaspirillum TaxID=2624150 RepID=UPI00161D7B94|nr:MULTISPECIES: sodium/glutamate symporter [unclassified Herbaspirillum]MBB3213970.1 ESS family glutamate:Na+ symporter [Herbaspirillum sp. Sphag1AN]MBB3247167.1 ESS family glutamate:Na+ symporter [Herbaspirillum sp. Sphag64]
MLTLNTLETLVAASLVLLTGRKLVTTLSFLKTYSIPEPVAGGLVVAILLFALSHFSSMQIRFDNTLQAPLMLSFFATIGLKANLASLRKGGRTLAIFLGVVLGLLMLQNTIGISMAKLMGLDPLVGLLGGSISLSGGHGTGAAWGRVFAERHGLPAATEIAIACATFGLIAGGLIGGPVAGFLVKRLATSPPTTSHSDGDGFAQPKAVQLITASAMIEALALIAISLSVGQVIADQLTGTPVELPTFVCVLFVGVIISNALSLMVGYKIFARAIDVLGNVSLSLFLAMALMSLRLGELASIALPVLLILAVQTIVMALYAILVTFRVMGSNYDAAVLAAGHCGFALGATPTAIANMQAVSERFGVSATAFLVVPMVSAFFIDIANALVIKLFLALPLYG